jgi:hypothetical protein
MMTFEERLLVELRQEVSARPAPARPRRGRLIAVGATALAAIAAAIAVALGGGSAAYAVEPGANGQVTVKIHDLTDAAGLQAKLREAGVPAVVNYGGDAPAGCGAGAPPPQAGAGGSGPVETTGRREAGDDGPSTARGPERGRSQAGGAPSLNTDGAHGADTKGEVTTRVEKTADGVTFTIDSGSFADGQQIYITTYTGAVEGIGMALCDGAR